ncbi:T9SS type B sorting domain-containing protein, partial [Neolewinella agarilytica]
QETVLDADGTVCVPCAGTPISCDNGSTSVVECDDNNPETINDVQTILDCNGEVCVPCMGVIPPGCPDLTFTIEVTSDFNGSDLTCNGAKDGSAMVSDVSSPYPPINYRWSNGDRDRGTEQLSSGWHSVTVTDGIGCVGIDSIFINQPELIVAALQASDSRCFRENNGSIRFDVVTGGTPPYRYSINGIDYRDDPQFDFLPPGTYLLAINDVNGCQFRQELTITEPGAVEVSLGLDTVVNAGDSLLIDPDYGFIVVDTFIWQGVNCINCPEAVISPTDSTNIYLEIADLNGCVGGDGLNIGVRYRPEIYIPNAFSPNGDNLNDVVYPLSGDDVRSVRQFLIYDRWGELVHAAFDFEPNDPNFGWDGRHDGKLMNPQVLVWLAEVEMRNGEIRIIRGDMVLMR